MIQTITIDGKTYALKPVQPPEKRRLIMTLFRHIVTFVSIQERVDAFKTVFTHEFPHTHTLQDEPCVSLYFGEWKYVLSDAQPEHINWAKSAKACGLIDNLLVDYGE